MVLLRLKQLAGCGLSRVGVFVPSKVADASSDAFQAKLKKDLNAQRKKMVNDAKTSVQAMVNLMERAPDRNTMDVMLESFAMVPDARGLEDILWKYFDNKLKGGEHQW